MGPTVQRLTRASWVATAVILACSTVSAATPHMVASGMGGTGVVATANGPLVALRPAGGLAFLMEAPEGKLQLVDEPSRGVTRNPGDPAAPFPEIVVDQSNRNVQTSSLQAMSASAELLDPDAVIIIQSVGASLRTTSSAQYTVRNVADKVIEESHVIASGDGFGEPGAQYYSYRSGAGLELDLSGSPELIIAGDFDVYFWGVGLDVSSASGHFSIRTGSWSQPNETFRQSWIVDEHNQYAILSVRGGSLQASFDGTVEAFAQAFEAEPGSAVFTGASGTVPVETGQVESKGGALQTVGGRFLLARDDAGVAVQTLAMPRSAVGTNAAFVPAPTPFAQTPLAWGLGLAAILLVAAGLGAYPTLRGRSQALRMQALAPGTMPMDWRHYRAEGYAAMAAAAEGAGHPRRAAFWMMRSVAAAPTDALRAVDAAILLAKAGRLPQSLRMHEAAHGWLSDAGSHDALSHNAFEASRTAALLGRKALALDWLRIALEANPAQSARLGKDPAFANLRDEPDYASLTMGSP